jgi:pimeloyl-ACP methyl ester carboxylesterase
MSESANTPTVVLVHGGFADASFWVPVIKDLQAHDLPVLAPPNPLRGLAHDAEYLASYVSQIDGPVLLVGHSYGGAVISVAGASTPNAVGLVFVAAFALDEGESFAEIFAQFGDTPLLSAVRPGTYPLPDGETAVELTIRPELYRPAFAADLPSEETAVLAVSQRPFAAIFDDRAQAAAWKTLPSWENATRCCPVAEHMAQVAVAVGRADLSPDHQVPEIRSYLLAVAICRRYAGKSANPDVGRLDGYRTVSVVAPTLPDRHDPYSSVRPETKAVRPCARRPGAAV